MSLLLPGLGHAAIGRPWRGVGWYLVSLISFLLLPVVVWMPLFMTVILVRVTAAVEVVLLRDVRAVAWNRVLLVWICMAVAAVGISQVVRATYLETYRIPSGAMVPTLQIGDHIVVDKLADVGRGDVAVFVNPCEPDKDFVKRVVAIGGDTVEVRCSRLYVNGEAVPAERVPGECSYWDRDSIGHWERLGCTRYRETIDGNSYDTVLPEDWPQRVEAAQRTPTHRAQPLTLRDFPTHRVPACWDAPDAGIGRIVASPSGNPDQCAPQRHYVVPRGYVFALGDNRHNSSDSRAWGPVPSANIKGKAFQIWWSSQPKAAGGTRWDRAGTAIR